jgi:hypothetical protein
MPTFPVSLRKTLIATLALALLGAFAPDEAAAQKRPSPKSRRGRAAQPQPISSPLAGKPIRIVRTDGLEISGKLVKLDLREVVYENSGGEQASIPLESVATLTLNDARKRADPQFLEDARRAVISLTRVATLVDRGPTLGQYDPLVTDVRNAVGPFLDRYRSGDQKEFVEKFNQALRGYEIVRPVWATRQGADQRLSLLETAPELRPVLQMYPDLEATEYNQNGRYPTDKVIAYVWNQVARQVRDLRGRLDEMASRNP